MYIILYVITYEATGANPCISALQKCYFRDGQVLNSPVSKCVGITELCAVTPLKEMCSKNQIFSTFLPLADSFRRHWLFWQSCWNFLINVLINSVQQWLIPCFVFMQMAWQRRAPRPRERQVTSHCPSARGHQGGGDPHSPAWQSRGRYRTGSCIAAGWGEGRNGIQNHLVMLPRLKAWVCNRNT